MGSLERLSRLYSATACDMLRIVGRAGEGPGWSADGLTPPGNLGDGMTAKMRELLRLRDDFRSRFPDLDGLISVGFSKSPDGLCLSVVVDRDSPQPELPDRFRDMQVRVE